MAGARLGGVRAAAGRRRGRLPFPTVTECRFRHTAGFVRRDSDWERGVPARVHQGQSHDGLRHGDTIDRHEVNISVTVHVVLLVALVGFLRGIRLVTTRPQGNDPYSAHQSIKYQC